MDGEAVIALVEHGKLEQLVSCGFKSVGEQMKLTKLVKGLTHGQEVKTTGTITSSSYGF